LSGAVAAVVLRTTAYGDHDLIVDLLGESEGRFSAAARGARRSRRRFGGALEPGTRLRVHVTRGRGALSNLGDCDVVGPILHIREDLDRITHLAYALEVTRLLVKEGDQDPDGYRLLVGYLEALEVAPATAEALVLWEIAMLAHHGYALRLDACVRTGGEPEGLSLSAGGALRRGAALGVPDFVPLPSPVFGVLSSLARGQLDVHLDAEHRVPLRRAFALIWEGVTGRRLKSAGFLV
jgi:DNA repair protein RecO (recombination protein O)